MSEARAAQRMTYAEYLALERSSDHKHEYVNGEVYGMSGGTPEHARLASRLAYLIGAALVGRPCEVFSSDGRVRIEATGRSTYPDLSVVCGQLQHAADDPDAITNPTVIVEVLSSSTERGDRTDKWAHCRRLPSLVEYVLGSQSERRIEVFRREGSEGTNWALREATAGQIAHIASIDANLLADEVYCNALG